MSILLIGFLMNDFFRKVFLAKDEIVNALIVDSSSALLQVAIVVYFHFSNPLAFDILVMMLGLAFIPSIVFGIIIIKPALIEKIELKTYSDSHIKQGKWLLLTALTQWWASNLFVVSSGIFLGVVSLGAFRLVQSLFGVLNLLLQTFENYILPKTSALWVKSQTESKSFLINISKKAGILFAIVLFVLFFFSDQVISLAGGKQYANYGYVVKGMSVLYLFIFIGYPIRIAIRMLILNRSFFEGYLISLVFSLISFKYLLATWNLWGAITGLIISQIILIAYWQYILIKNKFSLWK
jgi:O-antigen/teichoic acid export membrane protein